MKELTIIKNFVCEARQILNLSQQEMADKLGMSRATFSDLERANRNLTAIELLKIQSLLRVASKRVDLLAEAKTLEDLHYALLK